MNIILDVDYENYDRDCINISRRDQNVDDDCFIPYGKDTFLAIEQTPTFQIEYNEKKELCGFFVEIKDEFAAAAVKNGLDKKLVGKYDIPAWELTDLSAGEVIIEALAHVYRGFNVNDWKGAIKYLLNPKRMEEKYGKD